MRASSAGGAGSSTGGAGLTEAKERAVRAGVWLMPNRSLQRLSPAALCNGSICSQVRAAVAGLRRNGESPLEPKFRPTRLREQLGRDFGDEGTLSQIIIVVR
jgi:hypothetical protein